MTIFTFGAFLWRKNIIWDFRRSRPWRVRNKKEGRNRLFSTKRVKNDGKFLYRKIRSPLRLFLCRWISRKWGIETLAFKRRTLAQNKSPEYARWEDEEEGEIPEQNLKRLPDNHPILLPLSLTLLMMLENLISRLQTYRKWKREISISSE